MEKTSNMELIERLEREHTLTKDEFVQLIGTFTPEEAEYAAKLARRLTDEFYHHDIYMRGLIEFTNYCRNDCLYCGIRRSNRELERYRLSSEDILMCTDEGYRLGFRTFVLQGGEDPHFTDEEICDIVKGIKKQHPDCAVTLSIGEKTREQYLMYYQAGADRYLLRHETANEEHYRMLHPESLSLANRKRCLRDLKDIGYQVGTGFMVQSPYQRPEHLAEDLLFIKELEPHMIGIGPFVPHHATPFADFPAGTLEMTTFLISLLRLLVPEALIPATTALGTIDPMGREKGVLAGANVVMPNLSPQEVREKYMLYDNKICTGDEAAECRNCMDMRFKILGYEPVVDRGDHVSRRVAKADKERTD